MQAVNGFVPFLLPHRPPSHTVYVPMTPIILESAAPMSVAGQTDAEASFLSVHISPMPPESSPVPDAPARDLHLPSPPLPDRLFLHPHPYLFPPLYPHRQLPPVVPEPSTYVNISPLPTVVTIPLDVIGTALVSAIASILTTTGMVIPFPINGVQSFI